MYVHMFDCFLLAPLESVQEQGQEMSAFYILSQFGLILLSAMLSLVSDIQTVTTSFLTLPLLLWFF